MDNSTAKNCKHFHVSSCRQRKDFKAKMSILFLIVSIFLICLNGVNCGKHSKRGRKGGRRCSNYQVSPWTPCKKPCDMGISTRVVTSGKNCMLKKEQRLCKIRLCDEALFKPQKKGKSHCLRLYRSKEREYLHYLEARSEKNYAMKYCGVCNDAERCCTPTRVKTRKVRFVRKNGKKFIKKVAFIRKCHCHKKDCPPPPRSSFVIELGNDILREDGSFTIQQQLAGKRKQREKKRKNR